MSESALGRQRCRNHAAREAAARCSGCRRFYCRECVTEHEDRLVCAVCLGGLSAKLARPQGRGIVPVARMLQGLSGLLLAWTLFHAAGRILAELPSEVHENPTAGEAE